MSPSQPAPALLADAARGFFDRRLDHDDPELLAAIQGELARQQHQIELIASENIVSPAVLEAQGSVLTNKYAEGYPGRRYYGGCEFVDIAETLAIERAKQPVRLRLRQRPAAQRGVGQPRGAVRARQAGRHRSSACRSPPAAI